MAAGFFMFADCLEEAEASAQTHCTLNCATEGRLGKDRVMPNTNHHPANDTTPRDAQKGGEGAVGQEPEQREFNRRSDSRSGGRTSLWCKLGKVFRPAKCDQ
jgi:hypothetical protein